MPPALLSGLLILLMTGSAWAHRLVAEYRVLADQRVQIESWFDLAGESPKGAKVQVFRPDGTVLAEGILSDRGTFVFSYSQVEPLKVVVSAGAGHRKELYIPREDLEKGLSANATPQVTTAEKNGFTLPPAPEPEPMPFADRTSRVTFKDVLVGLGFIFALAAFVLSVRNAQQLKRIKSTGETGRNQERGR